MYRQKNTWIFMTIQHFSLYFKSMLVRVRHDRVLLFSKIRSYLLFWLFISICVFEQNFHFLVHEPQIMGLGMLGIYVLRVEIIRYPCHIFLLLINMIVVFFLVGRSIFKFQFPLLFFLKFHKILYPYGGHCSSLLEFKLNHSGFHPMIANFGICIIV